MHRQQFVTNIELKNIYIYCFRGALKYHIKAYALAIRDLTKAAAIDNTCALAYFNRAVCYHDSGNWQKVSNKSLQFPLFQNQLFSLGVKSSLLVVIYSINLLLN